MDEGMEASAPAKGAFGMRLFDAGEFHVGFGILAPPDEETTELSVQGTTESGCAIPAFARSYPVRR
jgi:hypothetical protein